MPVTDLQHLIKTFADGLKTMAQGIDTLADRVEELAKQQRPKKPKAAAARKAKPSAKAAAKAKKAASRKTTKKKTPKKAAAKATPAKKKAPGVLDQVHQTVKRAKGPVDAAEIAKRTGLARKQVTNALYKLKKQNKVTSKAKGLYEAA